MRSCCQTHFKLYPIHIGNVQNYSPLYIMSYCFLKDEPITLCLTNLTNLTVGQHFRHVVKIDPKPWKTSLKAKWLFWYLFLIPDGCLLSSLEGCLTKKLKFSIKTNIFIKFPQNRNFSHFPIDYPGQCCVEKAILMQNFCSWYLLERFSDWCTTLWTSRYFKI